MKHNFRKKKSQIKTNEDLELEQEISNLEDGISNLLKASLEVPDFMAQKLSDLKAKINPNKINAKKFLYNGTEYDSTREAKFAKALDASGLSYEYQVEIELQPKFKLENESIQDICIIVDFIVNGEFFVDVKGFILPIFNIKWKMLKYKYQHTREYFIIQKDTDINGFIAMAKIREWKNE